MNQKNDDQAEQKEQKQHSELDQAESVANGDDGEPGNQEVRDAIRKLGDQKPELIQEMLAFGSAPVGHPLHHKMNDGHISTILDLAVKHDEREFELAKGQQNYQASSRWFRIAVFVLILVFVVILLAIFRDDREILVPLVTGLLGFAGGFGGGWGLARHERN